MSFWDGLFSKAFWLVSGSVLDIKLGIKNMVRSEKTSLNKKPISLNKQITPVKCHLKNYILYISGNYHSRQWTSVFTLLLVPLEVTNFQGVPWQDESKGDEIDRALLAKRFRSANLSCLFCLQRCGW